MSIPLESLAAPTIICCITERERERERERKKEREGEEKNITIMITCIITYYICGICSIITNRD